MMPLVCFEEVDLAYGGRFILQGVSFCLFPKEVAIIRGKSGIGKSTLLRLAAGLLSPTAGTVRSRAKRIGFVFQEPRLLPWRTALQNVMLPLLSQSMSKKAARQKAQLVLERMDLTDFLHAHPAELSGGMRQRVSLARGIAVEPDLLLLDEPFTGLDPALRDSLRGYLEGFLAESQTGVLHVTHDETETVTGAGRVITVCDRKLIDTKERTHYGTILADAAAVQG